MVNAKERIGKGARIVFDGQLLSTFELYLSIIVFVVSPTRRCIIPRLWEIPGYTAHLSQGGLQSTFKPLEQHLFEQGQPSQSKRAIDLQLAKE